MRGFTLVEMLVALAVFSLISTAGVTALSYAVQNRGEVSERMERLGELQRARQVMKLDLSQAVARRVRGQDGRPMVDALSGSPRAGGDTLLRLVRRGWANPDHASRPSLQGVSYRVENQQLLRISQSALDGGHDSQPQVLLTGVRSARIEYSHRGQWIPNWPGGREQLPQAIRLELELEGHGLIRQLFLLPGGEP